MTICLSCGRSQEQLEKENSLFAVAVPTLRMKMYFYLLISIIIYWLNNSKFLFWKIRKLFMYFVYFHDFKWSVYEKLEYIDKFYKIRLRNINSDFMCRILKNPSYTITNKLTHWQHRDREPKNSTTTPLFRMFFL